MRSWYPPGAFKSNLYEIKVNNAVDNNVPVKEPRPPRTIKTNNSIDRSCEKRDVPKKEAKW